MDVVLRTPSTGNQPQVGIGDVDRRLPLVPVTQRDPLTIGFAEILVLPLGSATAMNSERLPVIGPPIPAKQLMLPLTKTAIRRISNHRRRIRTTLKSAGCSEATEIRVQDGHPLKPFVVTALVGVIARARDTPDWTGLFGSRGDEMTVQLDNEHATLIRSFSEAGCAEPKGNETNVRDAHSGPGQ